MLQAGGEYSGWDVLLPHEHEFRCPVCRRLATSAFFVVRSPVQRLTQQTLPKIPKDWPIMAYTTPWVGLAPWSCAVSWFLLRHRRTPPLRVCAAVLPFVEPAHEAAGSPLSAFGGGSVSLRALGKQLEDLLLDPGTWARGQMDRGACSCFDEHGDAAVPYPTCLVLRVFTKLQCPCFDAQGRCCAPNIRQTACFATGSGPWLCRQVRAGHADPGFHGQHLGCGQQGLASSRLQPACGAQA